MENSIIIVFLVTWKVASNSRTIPSVVRPLVHFGGMQKMEQVGIRFLPEG